MASEVLVINCGSSSLKLALFDPAVNKLESGIAERLDRGGAFAKLTGGEMMALPAAASHKDALEALVSMLRNKGRLAVAPLAIGHRVVHGGETFREAALIDEPVLGAIRECANLAPLHNPVNLIGIEAARDLYPAVPQVAVFDTAFHQSLPRRAWQYALPQRLYDDFGLRRYGFHGTSHSYMVEQAAALLGKPVAETSIISAHLGNGCSICAIHKGESVDTSMGFTPLEGLVMGTRSGDVDPGIFDFLQGKGLPATEVHRMLNQESGLLGISGRSNDMRTLAQLAGEGDADAALAIEIFCFRLAKYVGAMMASLTALDALVMTGGIGENSAPVRAATLAHLSLLGFALDETANANHGRSQQGRISAADSRFPVLVIPTDEEGVIAAEALRLS